MSEPVLRPRVGELVLGLYDRTHHPELFDTLASRRVCRDGYTLTVRITPAGHVLEWVAAAGRLAEVIAPVGRHPHAGRKLALRFDGEWRGRCEVGTGVKYQVSVQAEVLPPEVFAEVHADLATDGARRGMLFHFRPHNRLGLTPLGLVTAEAVPTGLAVAAFHTFPDEFVVVKTQSLVEPT